MELERREFLKALAALAGGTLSPACRSLVEGRGPGPPTGRPSAPLFTAAQRELVATAVELVIPATDTPGARDAGVHDFIEAMLVDWFARDERDAFLAGLARLDALARERAGAPFADAGESVQTGILADLEAEALSQSAPGGPTLLQGKGPPASPPRAFFAALKELVVVGYYTSEIGAAQELIYNHVAGSYAGCIPFGPIGRAWAE